MEDEALIALAEQRVLQNAGYYVTIAPTGETAVEIATTQPIDLVLMDVDLGDGISGTDAARTILAARDIPIVFLTSHNDPVTMEELRPIPRYGYVLKTSGEMILLEVLQMAFARAADRAAVKEARDLYQSVANLTGDIIVRHDADGNWVYLNDRAYEVWGVPQVDPATLNYLDYVEPEDREATQHAARTMRETRQPVSGLVNRIHTVEGWRTYQWNSTPVIGPEGEYLGFQSTGRDITAQKTAEDRIRGLLEERELLLREVHHRVKNDLNFVYSLLSLQASQTPHAAAQQALSEAGDRVLVLTDIYATLTARDTATAVSLRPLIETITDNLSRATLPDTVTVSNTLAEVTVPVRLSVSIGIICNELITNSAKYATSSSAYAPPTEIVVRLAQSHTPSAVVLSVSDSGPGFPQTVRDPRSLRIRPDRRGIACLAAQRIARPGKHAPVPTSPSRFPFLLKRNFEAPAFCVVHPRAAHAYSESVVTRPSQWMIPPKSTTLVKPIRRSVRSARPLAITGAAVQNDRLVTVHLGQTIRDLPVVNIDRGRNMTIGVLPRGTHIDKNVILAALLPRSDQRLK